jgi:hypothetical protein
VNKQKVVTQPFEKRALVATVNSKVDITRGKKPWTTVETVVICTVSSDA